MFHKEYNLLSFSNFVRETLNILRDNEYLTVQYESERIADSLGMEHKEM
jgi:hypothetical protein